MLDDDTFPLKLAHECKAVLTEKRKNGGPDFEFKEYMGIWRQLSQKVSKAELLITGVCHGFAIRPAQENPVHEERFVEAFDQTIAWFEKTLKEAS
jgi:hypothetical protein